MMRAATRAFQRVERSRYSALGRAVRLRVVEVAQVVDGDDAAAGVDQRQDVRRDVEHVRAAQQHLGRQEVASLRNLLPVRIHGRFPLAGMA